MQSTEIGRRLAAALATADLDEFGALLDPQVRWGGDEDSGDTCHSRAEVLAWYGRLRDNGVRAGVSETVERPGIVVLRLDLSWPDGAGNDRPASIFQVYRHMDGLIFDIRGYTNREQATASAAITRP